MMMMMMVGGDVIALSLLQASEDLLMQHYIDLKERPFFPTLINYMSSGPVVAMVRLGRLNPKSSNLKPVLLLLH